jgi:hypothetical protein
VSTRVLVGVGEDSVGQETYDTAMALAARLGTEAATFPGDHIGMATQPEAFARQLDAVLQADRTAQSAHATPGPPIRPRERRLAGFLYT